VLVLCEARRTSHPLELIIPICSDQSEEIQTLVVMFCLCVRLDEPLTLQVFVLALCERAYFRSCFVAYVSVLCEAQPTSVPLFAEVRRTSCFVSLGQCFHFPHFRLVLPFSEVRRALHLISHKLQVEGVGLWVLALTLCEARRTSHFVRASTTSLNRFC
jgi:hypothetical protein